MIEKTLKRILEKTINEINKNSNEEDFTVTDFFTTDFGKEFSESFLDLGYFIATATMLPPIIKSRNNFMEFVFSEKMIKMLEKSIGKDNGPTREEFEQVKKTLNSIKSLLEEEDKVEEETTDENNEIEELIEDLQILSRMTAYFIFALYAYLETCSKCLYREIISNIPSNQVYEIQNTRDLFSNPSNTIKILLKKLKVNDNSLNLILDVVLKKKSWSTKKEALQRFIDLRNDLAHNKPLMPINELKSAFKRETKRANKEANLGKEEFRKKAPDVIYKLIEPILEELKTVFLIRNIGMSCILYIVVVDKIVTDYFKLVSVEK